MAVLTQSLGGPKRPCVSRRGAAKLMATILVIDDDESVRDLLARILRREGHEVYVASDGEEGLAQFAQCHAQLVITDILMPGKEGLETIVALRAQDPEVKVIAVSGGGRNGTFGFLTTATRLGADRTLSKPFAREDLLAAVNELLTPDG
jgi:DNA-binding response OmpR family regulator